MIKHIAKWISRVFHPFMIPIYALLVLLVLSPLGKLIPTSSQMMIWMTTIVAAIILPMLVILILKHFGVLKKRNLDDREDRAWPLLALGVFLALGAFFLRLFPSTEIFSQLLFITSIQVLIFAVITLYWKISMHAMAWGELCGLFLMLGPIFKWAFVLSLICAGVVISSRLILRKHNGLQVLAGFAQGVIVTMIFLSL